MAKKKSKPKDTPPEPSIEDAMDELQEIVQRLESGQDPLDVSLQKFERGMELLRSCHQQLEQAASRIEILTGFDSDGAPTTAPFDGTSTVARQAASPSDEDEEEPDDDSETLF